MCLGGGRRWGILKGGVVSFISNHLTRARNSGGAVLSKAGLLGHSPVLPVRGNVHAIAKKERLTFHLL